jgi:hypothetical protein
MKQQWEEAIKHFYPQGLTAMKFIDGDWIEIDVTKEVIGLLSQAKAERTEEIRKSKLEVLLIAAHLPARIDSPESPAYVKRDDIENLITSLHLKESEKV